MTLYLSLHEGVDLQERNCIVYVHGGDFGQLRSAKGNYWNPAFQITCSDEDILIFRVCKEQDIHEPVSNLGSTQLNTNTFVKNNKRKLSRQTQHQFELEIRGENEQYKGKLILRALYDNSKKYQGEFTSNYVASFITANSKPKPIRQQPPIPIRNKSKKKVKFYKGKCQQNNIFSCFDSSSKWQQFHPVEKVYRDDY